MRYRTFLGASCAALLASVLISGPGPARAQDDVCTSSAPTDAVVKLPSPLDKWGQLICTPLGYALTGHTGWVWMQPSDHSLVIIPAQLEGAVKSSSRDGGKPAFDRVPASGKSYFTRIELNKVSGDEFEKAYTAFHDGFDPNEQKPAGYRLDLASAGGNTLTIYLFDYFTYGWGIACPEGNCDRSTRFVMLDMEEKPKELTPPI